MDPATVRHDFLRVLFAALLIRLPPELVREFWRSVKDDLDGLPGTEMELFRFLWKKTAQVPARCLFRIFDGLEPFCLKHGVEASALLDGMPWQAPAGTFIPGNTILPWLTPILPAIFKPWDPRVSVLKFLHLYSGNYFQGHVRHMVASRRRKQGIRFLSAYITDRGFRNAILFDCHLVAGSFLRNSPKMFGLPPFDSVSLLSDCRDIAQVVGSDASVETRGESIYLDGLCVGRWQPFAAVIDALGLDLKGYGIPECRVAVITREYRCPRRGRVVLFKDCAYGAPLYLQAVDFRPLPKDADPAHAADERAIAEWKLAEKRYAELLELSMPMARFTYLIRQDAIELNGKVVARSIPAKILRYILSRHVQDGRDRFLNLEFRHNREITYDPDNPNFEVRLWRLADKLNKKMPSIRLIKAERGVFLFEKDCRVEYQEV